MLMGAIANMAPEKFAGIIAAVPFVDVLNTMLDDTLPLTPAGMAGMGAIRSSPEENIAGSRPTALTIMSRKALSIIALSGLTDPRVTYWEPTKWIARLRDTAPEAGPFLLKTNMAAGHGDKSGTLPATGRDRVRICLCDQGGGEKCNSGCRLPWLGSFPLPRRQGNGPFHRDSARVLSRRPFRKGQIL